MIFKDPALCVFVSGPIATQEQLINGDHFNPLVRIRVVDQVSKESGPKDALSKRKIATLQIGLPL